MAEVNGNADSEEAALKSDSDSEDDDSSSDTSSILQDIVLNSLQDYDAYENGESIPGLIPVEEARVLRARLREIGPDDFVRETVTSGAYKAKRLLTAFGMRPPELLEGHEEGDGAYYRLLGIAIIRFLTTRHKLPQYNTIDDTVELLNRSNNIMVITGAGISTNLGVPDFRSKDTGFYEKMRQKGFDSPEEIFDFFTFKEDPTVFYENSGPTLPELGKSTPTHAFIKLLEAKGKLLTNYTQNIDNVEANVGISNDKLIQCHGSWATFTCLKCGRKAEGQQFYDDVRRGKVVYCAECPTLASLGKRKRSETPLSRPRKNFDSDDKDDDEDDDIPQPGVMKPDITFFGEKLPDHFFERFHKHDRDAVDLVIVIGTSMMVAPVSEIPLALDHRIPHIYISRDRIRHFDFDITLLGDCDLITEELSRRAGWDLQHQKLKHRRIDFEEANHELAIWRIASSEKDGPDVDAKPQAGPVHPSPSPEPEKLAA